MRVLLLLLIAACAAPPASKPADTDVTVDTDRARGPLTVRDTAPPSGQVTIELLDNFLLVAADDPSGSVPGRVTTEVHALDTLTLTASSSKDGPLAPPVLEADGTFAYPTDQLTVGLHDLTLTVTDPDGSTAEVVADLTICQWPAVQTFDANPIGSGWTSYGTATWDPQGWMEITDFKPHRFGSVWYTQREVDPGNVELRFRIATGGLGGLNGSGADGYAISVVDVPDLVELEKFIHAASDGGCLGYGIKNGCGNGSLAEVNAFHIEFDTWSNGWDPLPHTDTTSENHVSVMLDGDATNHILWKHVVFETAVPQWHDVAVIFRRDKVRVMFDGKELMTSSIPGFTFDGGWIGVSGSTGDAYNWHRFDDLQLRDRCDVP